MVPRTLSRGGGWGGAAFQASEGASESRGGAWPWYCVCEGENYEEESHGDGGDEEVPHCGLVRGGVIYCIARSC